MIPIDQQRAPNKPAKTFRPMLDESTLSAALFVELWEALLEVALVVVVASALAPFPISLAPKLLVGIALLVSKLVTLVGKKLVNGTMFSLKLVPRINGGAVGSSGLAVTEGASGSRKLSMTCMTPFAIKRSC